MLRIKQELCTGCGKCAAQCPFGSIRMEGNTPVVGEDCALCASCVSACPVHAIELDDQSAPAADLSDYRDIWVVVEQNASTGRLQKVSLELLSEARKLADRLGQQVGAVLLCGEEPREFEEQVKSVGCDLAYVVENRELSCYDTCRYSEAAAALANKYKPWAVLFPATERGRDLAPRVAVQLQAGLTADCTGLDMDDKGNLVQIRPTYGGNIMASIISPNHRPQMASIRPNVFPVEFADTNREFRVIREQAPGGGACPFARLVRCEKKDSAYKNVAEADIVVVAGYGVGSKENYKAVEQLAVKLGAAIGATRKVVDEGWAPYEVQVGQTGKTIAPSLYIAFGVSGALQHSIGMRNAKYKIAVNTDPAAQIFKMCDVAILGDCVKVAGELCRLLDA